MSSDDGDSWRNPEPLRYRDDGVPVLQPVAPAPSSPWPAGAFCSCSTIATAAAAGTASEKREWKENEANHLRNPAWLALGEFRPDAHQARWFGAPKNLLDTDGTSVGLKRSTGIATYASLTAWKGVRTLWRPDRTYYLPGGHITGEWLADMGPVSSP